MTKAFYMLNRQNLLKKIEPGSAVVLFAGEEVRKTNDEYYPFYARRSFVYLTGIEQKQSVYMAVKTEDGDINETLYLLESDMLAERWTGRRLTANEASEISGIASVKPVGAFLKDFDALASGGHYSLPSAALTKVYLDLYRADERDGERPDHVFARRIRECCPYIAIGNADALIRELRLYKQPCEIDALRTAEKITGEGIAAMMAAARPGIYEYQLKAEFDRALNLHGTDMHGFPPIISAGKNNFCIHYYSYGGKAEDGDMVLNDVGAKWNGVTVDVSRGWPVNGRFTDRQALLYECALKTSDHMFEIVKPGLPMDFIDKEIRRYNAERLVEAGALDKPENVARLMWHGGAHHIGWDVHDVVKAPKAIAPGMVFCIDVGIYNEAWGIGFRLEDNLLVTESGCENLSRAIPRTIADIENALR